MKLITLLLNCSAAYLADASQAHAGIETLIAGAIQGFLLSSTAIAATATGAIATVAANLIVAGAVVGASLLLAAGQTSSAAVSTADAKSTFETGESSVLEGVGRVRIGGLQAFGNTDGSTRGRLLCRLQGPIDTVEAHYLGQREVTVEANGDVSSPPWARPDGSWCNWQNKRGDGSETAWAGLMSLFPDLWTSAHKARGIAQSQLLFYNPGLSEEKYLSLYQGGVPESEWIVRASLVYDPRDGSQSIDNPLTWKWSDNSILVLAHVLRRDPAFTSSRFNWTLIAQQSNKADELVATKTGTEKRSRLWGTWQWEASRSETMQKFMDSAGAEIRMDDDGLIWFELIDDEITAEIDFSPVDIYDYQWKSGPEAVERPNICRLSYYSPEQNYDVVELNLEGIAWAQIDDEVDRYGPKYSDLDLSFCPSASQAQRIARRLFAQSRAATGTIVTNMVGLAAWGLLYAEIEEPDLEDIIKVRMEPPRIDDDNGQVEIPFKVWPSLTAWNPETDEADAPETIPEMGYETDMITPSPPTAAIQVTFPDGGAKEVRIGYALPAQSYNVVEVNYRTYTGGLPDVWQSMTEIGGTVAYVAGDLIGETIDARVRVFNGDDGTLFSDPANLTVVVNNTACGQPAETATGPDGAVDPLLKTLDVTVASYDLQVVALRVRFWNGTSFETVSQSNAHPYQEIHFTAGPPAVSGFWRIDALTSNGTAGTPRDYSVTVEGGGGD